MRLLRVLDHCVRRVSGERYRGEGIEGEGANLQWVVGVFGWHGVQGLAVAGVVALCLVVSNVGWDAAVLFGSHLWRSDLLFLECHPLEHGLKDHVSYLCSRAGQDCVYLCTRCLPFSSCGLMFLEGGV
jgi:hypothetical protein